jgi:3-deoxy-7-phosphoheptulonate synthase
MLIVMRRSATEAQVNQVLEVARAQGLTPVPIPGAQRTAVGLIGNQGAIDPAPFQELAGVRECIRVSRPYKLVSRETKPEDTVVTVHRTQIGEGSLALIAGPCGIESAEQALTIARRVKEAGASLFRGGLYKPRTSPYSFQGMQEKGLDILRAVRQETDLGIVTEVIDRSSLEAVHPIVDMVQVGARNMQNFRLLRAVGQCGKPVLLKRGMSATLEEFFMAAEYILSEGNYDVVLCERGVRTYLDHTRNTLDLAVIPAVKSLSHLPIIADPSHAAGIRAMVRPLALAAAAAGADGLMVEVHHEPDRALSDGPQSLLPEDFVKLTEAARAIHQTQRSQKA